MNWELSQFCSRTSCLSKHQSKSGISHKNKSVLNWILINSMFWRVYPEIMKIYYTITIISMWPSFLSCYVNNFFYSAMDFKPIYTTSDIKVFAPAAHNSSSQGSPGLPSCNWQCDNIYWVETNLFNKALLTMASLPILMFL